MSRQLVFGEATNLSGTFGSKAKDKAYKNFQTLVNYLKAPKAEKLTE